MGIWLRDDARLRERLRPGQCVLLKVLRRLSDGRMLARMSDVKVVLEADVPLSAGHTYWAVVGHLGDPIVLRICKVEGRVDFIC